MRRFSAEPPKQDTNHEPRTGAPGSAAAEGARPSRSGGFPAPPPAALPRLVFRLLGPPRSGGDSKKVDLAARPLPRLRRARDDRLVLRAALQPPPLERHEPVHLRR